MVLKLAPDTLEAVAGIGGLKDALAIITANELLQDATGQIAIDAIFDITAI